MKNLGNEDELALVLRASAGSSEAFGELVRRYAPRVSALVYQHVGDSDAALDICQTAFLKAFRQVHSLRAAESFRPWLFRIAVNESVRFHKTRARQRALGSPAGDALEEVTSNDPRPVDRLVDEEQRAAVLQALDQLPPRQRSVFVLRYFQGLSTAETAEALSCSPNAVKATLSYALKTLSDKLIGGEERE